MKNVLELMKNYVLQQKYQTNRSSDPKHHEHNTINYISSPYKLPVTSQGGEEV